MSDCLNYNAAELNHPETKPEGSRLDLRVKQWGPVCGNCVGVRLVNDYCIVVTASKVYTHRVGCWIRGTSLMGFVVLWIEKVEEIKYFYRNIENERQRLLDGRIQRVAVIRNTFPRR